LKGNGVHRIKLVAVSNAIAFTAQKFILLLLQLV